MRLSPCDAASHPRDTAGYRREQSRGPCLYSSLLSFSALMLVFGLVAGPVLGADLFDKHDFSLVKQAASDLPSVPRISMQDASKLKPLSATISTPCLIVKTSEGNFAKMLVSWGFRKNGEDRLPVLLIERFVTYRGDRPEMTAATGKDILLFAGFEFDFDIGQVVPPKAGGDISFSAESVLEAVPPSILFALSKSLVPAEGKPVTAEPGTAAQGFAGDWIVNADDRWNGEWSLKVDGEGRIVGKFVSSESQNTYDITGNLSGLPHQARLEIFLANTQISVEAYLWTNTQNDMAGVVTVAGRKFGFFARRSQAGGVSPKTDSNAPDSSIEKGAGGK